MFRHDTPMSFYQTEAQTESHNPLEEQHFAITDLRVCAAHNKQTQRKEFNGSFTGKGDRENNFI